MREMGILHDSYTFPLINRAASLQNVDISCGETIHALAIKMGFHLQLHFCNSMIDFYGKAGFFTSAFHLFEEMPERDLVSWTSLISSCLHDENSRGVFELLSKMRREFDPNSVTFLVILKACPSVVAVHQIHGLIIKDGFLIDKSVKNSVLNTYACFDSVTDAEALFGEGDREDVVSWNIMISMYSSRGETCKMIDIFYKMSTDAQPTIETISSLMSGLAKGGNLCQGRQIHSLALKSGLYDDVAKTSFLYFYSKHGELERSAQLFYEVLHISSVTWNAMMSGFIENELYEEAVVLFHHMLAAEIRPPAENLCNLLLAYACLGALQLGKAVHGYLVRNSYFSLTQDVRSLETSLLNLYIKCGAISTARIFFDKMAIHDLVAWTSMIEGYGTHGMGLEALDLFKQMTEKGIGPNSVTFLSLLFSCSHSGHLSEGCRIFSSMKWICSMEPSLSHYTCLVDMLGRSGKIKEALTIILKFVPYSDSRIWGALLAASRVYEDQKIARYAAERFLELEPENAGYHTLLSNTEAIAGSWTEVEEIRSAMKDKHLSKQPGWSCIELQGLLHGFASGDRSHTHVVYIYDTLDCLSRNTVSRICDLQLT